MSDPRQLADGRDPIDVAEQWVKIALQGHPWESRDSDGAEPCFVERGTDRDGDGQRFIESPLTYLDACIIEELIEVARTALDALEAANTPRARDEYFAQEKARLEAALEAANKALRFYADVENWTQVTPWGTRMFDEESAVIKDYGKRAAAALAGGGHEEPEHREQLEAKVLAALVGCTDHAAFSDANCPRCAAIDALSRLAGSCSPLVGQAAQDGET